MPRDPNIAASGLIGNAGEHFVAAELMRRGWTAALTARNNHAWDVLASKGEHSVRIRVKTKTSVSDVFQWSAKKNGQIFLELSAKNDFCILVDVPLDGTPPGYYIVPTVEINAWLVGDFEEWVSTPGAKGQQRAQDNPRRLFYVDDRAGKISHGYRPKLEPYREGWSLLEGVPLKGHSRSDR